MENEIPWIIALRSSEEETEYNEFRPQASKNSSMPAWVKSRFCIFLAFFFTIFGFSVTSIMHSHCSFGGYKIILAYSMFTFLMNNILTTKSIATKFSTIS